MREPEARQSRRRLENTSQRAYPIKNRVRGGRVVARKNYSLPLRREVGFLRLSGGTS